MAKKLEELDIGTLPWTAKQGYNAWRVLSDGGRSILIDDEYGEEYGGADLSQANARLIAAAPELYQSVCNLLEICGNTGEYIGIDCGTIEKIEKAKAALAKASGEVANG